VVDSPTLAACFLAPVIGQAVLTLTLASFLGLASFVLDTPQRSFGFNSH